MGGMARSFRLGATVLIVAALWMPVVLDRDSIPLSTYPMYSSSRGASSGFVTAELVSGDDRSYLSLAVVGASDDPLVVAGDLRAAIRNDVADRRCAEIADRAASAGLAAPGDTVEVVSETHDSVAFVAGDPSLVERTMHARCEVPG